MKKILIFVALFFIATEMNLQASALKEDHRGTTVEVERRRDEEGVGRLFITGTGTHNFHYILGDGFEERYNIETLMVENDLFILNGFITNQKEQTINPFMKAITHEGEIIFTKIFDSGFIESIIDLYIFEDYEIIHLRREVLNESTAGFDYLNDRFIKMKGEEVLKTRVVDQQINDVEIIDETLVLRKNANQDPVHIILPDFKVIEEGVLAGVVDTMTYYDTVTLYFTGELLINNEPFIAPLTIDTIGEYDITYLEETLSFTLLPTVDGVNNQMVTNHPVTINYSTGQPKLNGYLYQSGTEISAPGYYTLSFEQGDYIHDINFTITSNIEGVYHNQTYDHPKRITFNGDGYLNNQLFESGNLIDSDGEYILRIYGVNHYEEAHHFKIQSEPESETLNHLKVVELSLLAGAIFIGGYLIYGLIKKN